MAPLAFPQGALMPNPISHSNSLNSLPANSELQHPLNSLDGRWNARPYSQTIALSPTCRWSSYFFAHLILGSGLAAIAMLFGLVFWRLVDLPRSGQTATKHRASTPVRPMKPRQEIVFELERGQDEQIKDTPNPLVDSRQDLQRDDLRPKEQVVEVPLRFPEPRTADPIPPRLPQVFTADQILAQRLQASEDDLLSQLAAVPELRLLNDSVVQNERQAEQTAQRNLPRMARDNQRAAEKVAHANHIHVHFQVPRAEIIALQHQMGYEVSLRLHEQMRRAALHAGLRLRPGPQSKLPEATAKEMAELSKDLRKLGFVTVPGVANTKRFPSVDPARSADVASEKVSKIQHWCDQRHLENHTGTMPTLIQMLQIENEPTRLLLVRELTRSVRRGATTQLAGRAILDLSPRVRQAAVAGLEGRPSSEYVPILLWGLRYPWPPVADHAAAALRTLKASEAVPSLVGLLDLPWPSAPVLEANTNRYTVRELVRLNHLRNCLLCHAPSLNEDDGLVRGLVPIPGNPLATSTSSSRNYYEGVGDFVRADITYLHQDFSANLSDEDAGRWPREQRYDFVTRLRTVSPTEIADVPASAIYPQRDALLYALRGLTGKDGGDSSARWRSLLDLAAEKTKDQKNHFPLEKFAVSPNDAALPG